MEQNPSFLHQRVNTFLSLLLIFSISLLFYIFFNNKLFTILALQEQALSSTPQVKIRPKVTPTSTLGETGEWKSYRNEKQGVLEGKATVGPICPVEKVGEPCPILPETYTSREVIIYTSDKKNIVARAHFDRNGDYRFELPAGTYVVDIGKLGVDYNKDLPHEVSIQAGKTVTLNIDIDTGIR